MGDKSGRPEPDLSEQVLEEVSRWEGLATTEEIERLLDLVRSDVAVAVRASRGIRSSPVDRSAQARGNKQSLEP